MKKFKKIMLLASAGTILVASLAGCGSKEEAGAGTATEDVAKVEVNVEGYPVVSEPIQIDAFAFGEPGAGDWKDYQVFKDLSEKTGVQVNFETVSGDGATEKLNLRLSSPDTLPDVFFSGLSNTMINKYAKMGLFVPLQDLIAEYAPNITAMFEANPEFKKAMTMPDGNIYALGAINEASAVTFPTYLFLNKTWLDNLGLEVPTTTEEFKVVLEAFKTQDPNGNGEADEIPFSYEPRPPYNVWNGDTGFSGPFGVVDDSTNMMVKGDELVFTPMEEGYKEYIKWTRDLYTNKLLDAEIFTQDHNQYAAKMNSDYLGGYLASGPGQGGDEWIAIDPLIGPNGDQMWSSLDFSVDRNRAIISVANPYPEATIRYIDTFFEAENTLSLRHGDSLIDNGDGTYDIKKMEAGEQKNAPGPYVPSFESIDMIDNMLVKTEDGLANEARKEQYKPFANPAMPLMNFTAEETQELSTIAVDIQNYVSEMKAKWTTGQADIDADWDTYVETLQKMQVERYIEIYNQAFDRYNGN